MATLERFPRRAGVATLIAREQLTPRMLRVTLRSDDFGADWPLEQPGEILTLLFLPQDEAIVLPEQGWRFPEGAPEQAWRNYTVRSHRPEACEIDVDVVLHQPRGPACTWADASAVGASVGYAGPRIDFVPVDDAPWLLLCGDETALPAIAAILETAPPEQPVTAFVEVRDGDDELPVSLGEHQSLRWVHRETEATGTTDHLAAALRAHALPAGDGQAWGAGESKVARDLRGVLRDEHGMPKTHARARGYWLRTGEWDLDE
jgi:NADPH-dependent ferric siderophore reductase